MANLRYKNKILLPHLLVFRTMFQLSRGFMFSSPKRIEKGAFFVLPRKKASKTLSTVTMFFVFHPLDIVFLDEEYKVVDKITLTPWVSTYIPKNPARYIVEAKKDYFKEIKLGEILKLEE